MAASSPSVAPSGLTPTHPASVAKRKLFLTGGDSLGLAQPPAKKRKLDDEVSGIFEAAKEVSSFARAQNALPFDFNLQGTQFKPLTDSFHPVDAIERATTAVSFDIAAQWKPIASGLRSPKKVLRKTAKTKEAEDELMILDHATGRWQAGTPIITAIRNLFPSHGRHSTSASSGTQSTPLAGGVPPGHRTVEQWKPVESTLRPKAQPRKRQLRSANRDALASHSNVVTSHGHATRSNKALKLVDPSNADSAGPAHIARKDAKGAIVGRLDRTPTERFIGPLRPSLAERFVLLRPNNGLANSALAAPPTTDTKEATSRKDSLSDELDYVALLHELPYNVELSQRSKHGTGPLHDGDLKRLLSNDGHDYIEKLIGYVFRDSNFLREALYVGPPIELGGRSVFEANRRLAMVGDSALKLAWWDGWYPGLETRYV